MARFRLKSGRLHYGGRTYLPGDVFEAPAHRMEGFEVERLDLVEEETTPPKAPGAELKLKYVRGGWYDVINPATGKAVNSRRLRRAEAEALIRGGAVGGG